MINAVLDLLAPARGAGEYWVVGVSLRGGLVSCASVAGRISCTIRRE